VNANGIKLMLKRRGLRAGIDGVHAHRWRHTYAHELRSVSRNRATCNGLIGYTR
jgi:integrase